MKSLLFFSILLALICVAGCSSPQTSVPEGDIILHAVPGFSKSDPAPANTAVDFTEALNDSGQGYAEYSGKLTLLEVLRGAAAMDKMKHDNPYYFIDIQSDREFLVARFKYELLDTSPHGVTCLANRDSFRIYRDGKFDTEDNKLILGPTPDFYGKVKKGGAVDGWIVFTVPGDASNPLIVFGGSATGSDGIWFKAY